MKQKLFSIFFALALLLPVSIYAQLLDTANDNPKIGKIPAMANLVSGRHNAPQTDWDQEWYYKGTNNSYFAPNGYGFVTQSGTTVVYRYQWDSNLLMFFAFNTTNAGSYTHTNGVSYIMPPKGNYTISSSLSAGNVSNIDAEWDGDITPSFQALTNDITLYFNGGTVSVAEGVDGPYIEMPETWCYYIYNNEWNTNWWAWRIGSPAVYRTVSVRTDDNTETKGTVSYVMKSGYVYTNNIINWKNGSVYTLTASAKSGYHFVCWKKGNTVISSAPNNEVDVTIDGDATYTAYFEANISNVTITLDNQSATTAGTETVSATVDANTNLTSAIIKPTKTGLHFGGYYTEINGDGVQIIDEDGNFIASAGGNSTYLDAYKNWKYGGNITLYAKWYGRADFEYNFQWTRDGGNLQGGCLYQSTTGWKYQINHFQLLKNYSNTQVVAYPAICIDIISTQSTNTSGGYKEYGPSGMKLYLPYPGTYNSIATASTVGYNDRGCIVKDATSPATSFTKFFLSSTESYNITSGSITFIEVTGQTYPFVLVEGTFTSKTVYVTIGTAPTYTITLNSKRNDNNATTAGTASVTVTYGESTNLTSAINIPTLTGYTFGGYWTNDGGTGTQVIDANGNFIASVDGYTNARIEWRKAEAVTLYAKWIAKTYTVNLDNQSATTAGQASVTATYNAAMPSIENNLPVKTNNIFGGYWTGTNGSGTKYYNADGTSATNWTIDTNPYTLYAHWISASQGIITAVASPDAGGSVTVSPSGQQNGGTKVTLTVEPNSGYSFQQWDDGNTDNPRTVYVDGSRKYIATLTQQSQITTSYAYLVRSSYSGSSTINIRGRNSDYEVSVGLTATSLTQTGSVTFRSDATNSYILDLATGVKTTLTSGEGLSIANSSGTYTLTGTLNGGEYRVTMVYSQPGSATNDYASTTNFNPTFSSVTIGGTGTTRTITATSGSTNNSNYRKLNVEMYVPSGTANGVIPTGIYYVRSGSSAYTVKQSSGRSGTRNYTYNTSNGQLTRASNNTYIYFRTGIIEVINVGNKATPDYIRVDAQNTSAYLISPTYGTKPTLLTVNISAENGTVGLSANSDPVGGKYYNGTTITLTPDAADGFVFDSWSGGTPTDNEDGTYTITLSGDVNLTANFIESYTVSFDAGKGTGSMSDQEVGVGKTVNLTANEFTGPSITVYYEYNDATGGNSKASETVNSTFLSWSGSDGEFYDDEAEITDIAAVGETVTMTAQWAFNDITLPTPTKTGHTFLAWEGTFGGMNLSEDAGAEVSVEEGGTFTAQWEINKYTVTVNTNPSGYGTVRIGSEAEQAQVQIADVPHFSTFTTPSTGTIVIKGNTVTATPASDAAGYTYTFQNWTNGTATVIGTTTVTANFTRSLIPYSITYNLNDGTNPSPAPATSYNVETATITLPTPTKEGYNFLGWYANSDLTTGGVVTTIPVGSYGDKVFWAKWEAKTYAITYNAGANGTGTIAAGEKTYNEDFTLSNSTFTRTGYTQTGWSTTDGGAKAYDLGDTYTGNTALDLYPYWEVNFYSLNWTTDGDALTGTYTSGTVKYGTTIVQPNTPTKAGYTFNGWFPTPAATMPAEATTYTATWNAVSTDLVLKDGVTDEQTDIDFDAFKATYNGQTMSSVTLNRTFTAGNWATICLPFDVDESQLSSTGLFRKVYEFRYATGSADAGKQVTFHFRVATSMEAGRGYLVKGASGMGSSFVFNNVTINTSADTKADVNDLKGVNYYYDESVGSDIVIVGVLRSGTLRADGKKVMGLANNMIWYPHTNGNPMPAYRAYFYNPDASDAVMPRVRIVVEGEGTTELEVVDGELYDANNGFDADGDVRAPSGAARKYIRNGVLIIERNGVTYDAQGKRL